MSPLWTSDTPPDPVVIPPLGWLLAAVRAPLLIVLITVCLILLLLLRLVEVPIWGRGRPITPFITQFVCRNALRILGIGFTRHGRPMRGPGAVVANHSSWLDIFTLNAAKRIYFVSKAEVASWPGIGILARATGTIFIERDRRHAHAQTRLFADRLAAGHKLLFFPEGTSTDGLRVLPFKTTLFGAFFAEELRHSLRIQPVSVIYHAPASQPARFYGWWGDMSFGSHLIKTLATLRHGRVDVVYHPPLKVSDFDNRKALAARAEEVVRAGLERYLPRAGT
ncbi:lysophospholipid acyltransferase family protein [Pseudodonghicola flavimaris]|uniref:Lysophospholipid acyltransferase family protein n=1 Tax=Pseudodonghicola flavimaris TaxID=3050036 RepID=A0ABT7F162_9RHOB|nr:lysophospholipid acyltransferase family protein [Pseudodonghicola flavimaris]MDK3018245.1 lysophospholipid acyltransferase family protein [Pseudodonghicola flavimaris]